MWTRDLSYVLRALVAEQHSYCREPMPYNFLPRRIDQMRKAGITGWECGILNTSRGKGIHWVLATGNATGRVDLWEPYSENASQMEHVVDFLRKELPSGSIEPRYTGIQPATNTVQCGYISQYMQLLVHQQILCGAAPSDMGTMSAPPPGWYAFVHALLGVRDEQQRVLGQVSTALGLQDFFQRALDAGRFSLVAVKRQLTDYVRCNLEVYYACLALPALRCLALPCLVSLPCLVLPGLL
jgi:hypothetical protein